MKNYPLPLCLCLVYSGCAHAKPAVKAVPASLVISKGQPITIVLPAKSSPTEETAAAEVSGYLTRIAGVKSVVVHEDASGKLAGMPIYIGSTRFAAQHPLGKAAYSDEEWSIQTAGNALILTGGAPRGTLYAAYHFLEDICGVHWWNPWEESVPGRTSITIKPIERRSKPAFFYRDIYSIYAYDGGRFAARNRINRQGFDLSDVKNGGRREIGPPDSVHTFFSYISPEKYYVDHPDWFLIDASRTFMAPGPAHIFNSQLNLSNKGMRAEFLKLLRENIRTSRKAALEKGQTLPDIFDVSQNDGGVSWVGKDDEELVKREGTNAASMISFINYLADGIREEFPSVYIQTLAYHSGEKAPKTLRPRDNVIVRLTDTRSNYLLPVTDPRNKILRTNVEEWSKLAKNLYIWDYNVTFVHPEWPTPTLHTYAPDLKFFKDHNVTGYLTEFEYPIEADLRDLKVWVLCKLLEDPSLNTEALTRQFTAGFYGPAAPYIRQYMAALDATVKNTSAKQGTPDITWFAGTGQFTYLTREFLEQAQGIFDKATAAAKGNAVLERRVRHARLAVDSATLMRYPQLMAGWVRAGGQPAAMKLDRDAVAKRFLQTWNEQVALRPAQLGREKARKETAELVRDLTAGPKYVPLPAKFKTVPVKDIFAYGVQNTRYCGPDPLGVHTNGLMTSDPAAASQVVRRYVIPDSDLEKYKLPMPIGVYANTEEKSLVRETIRPEDVPGPGYNWYKVGVTSLTPSSYVHFMWSWYLQVDIGGDVDARNANQKYEVWANIKLEGPAFPFGKAEDKNAVSVDQVVLVRQH